MVIVTRNLERANENDGFKMTALEFEMLSEIASKIRNNRSIHFENLVLFESLFDT